MNWTKALYGASPLVFLLACTEGTPGQDMSANQDLPLVLADQAGLADMSQAPDLTDTTQCLHGQVARAGACICAAVADQQCGEGHCCDATQTCLPALAGAPYRCSGPSGRLRAAVGHDSVRKATLVFGGTTDVNTSLGSHHELDPATWSPLSGAALTGIPSARHGAMVTYDQANSRLLLFGGQTNGTTYLGDLYSFDGKTWVKIVTPSAPSPRAIGGMAYDSARKVVVLYGGDTKPAGATDSYLSGETWEYAVQTRVWTLRAMEGSGPRSMEGVGLAYDAKNGRTVLFGGAYGLYQYSNETWTWNGSAWTKLTTTGVPNPRAYFGMAYDANRGVVAISGGETNAGLFQALGDLWELDGSTWRNRTLAVGNPSGRSNNALVYDAGRKLILNFGGLQNNTMDASGELWGWDGTAWSQLY